MKTLILAVIMAVTMSGCKKENLPVVETGGVTEITSTSVRIAGQISSDGGCPILEKGICLADDVNDKIIDEVGGTSILIRWENLDPVTSYRVRAYAINKIGAGYGKTVTFETAGETIGDIASVSKPTTVDTLLAANLLAKVNPNGLETTVSFEYGTDPNSLTNSVPAFPNKISGMDDIDVKAKLIGLDPTLGYYCRVKAVNSKGTKVSDVAGFRPYAVSDANGNLYHCVKIGAQIWLQENLKATKYASGAEIANVTDLDIWCRLTTGAYCWYDNDPKNGQIYGALYNWYVGGDNGRLLINGWHVPAVDEWTQLRDFLGGDYPAGAKVISLNPNYWVRPPIINPPLVSSINSSGFTALPNGFVAVGTIITLPDGTVIVPVAFSSLGLAAIFWSANSVDGRANDINIRYSKVIPAAETLYQQCGLALRLLKN